MLELAHRRRAPRGEVSASARRLLRWSEPRLAPAALKPLFIGGEDLRVLGLPPGEAYRRILELAASLQWQGKLKSRAQALGWVGRTGPSEIDVQAQARVLDHAPEELPVGILTFITARREVLDFLAPTFAHRQKRQIRGI